MTTDETTPIRRRRTRDVRVWDTKQMEMTHLFEVLETLERENAFMHDRIQAVEHRLADIERGL